MIEYLKKFLKIMGIKIGDVDVSRQIIENEFFIKTIDKYFDLIFKKNPSLNKPTIEEVEAIKQEVIKELQNKYPNSGLEYKK